VSDGNLGRAVALSKLLEAEPSARVVGEGDLSSLLITGLFSDSRVVAPGGLFVALRGQRFDGHRYIPFAIRQGAAAVVGEEESALRDLPVPAIIVPDARAALGRLASAFYGHPSHQMALIGITGTDGKTTTTHLIASLLQGAGRRTGLLSTVSVGAGEQIGRNETPFTTPEALEVQRRLAEMAAAGCQYVALEVSSHAIATQRVEGCAFDVAVFTNLTPEHLDYHRTVEEYFETKAKLFQGLGERAAKSVPAAAVINSDDRWGPVLARRSRVPVVTYGLNTPAVVTAKDVRLGRDGTDFTIVTPQGSTSVHTQLVGQHNVYNWLAAVGTALSQGLELAQLTSVIERTPPVQGRLQWVERGQPFTVLVDFAHTPNALAQTLDFVRSWTQGRLIVVFGHAGGRDLYNRPQMGRVVAERADYFVITTDDPGDEQPLAIAAEVERGAREAGAVSGKNYVVELDRRQAFAIAFATAQPGDTVLLAGRGHERFMPVAMGQMVPFDDAQVAAELLDAAQHSKP